MSLIDTEFKRVLDNSYTVQELIDTLNSVPARFRSLPIIVEHPPYFVDANEPIDIDEVEVVISDGYVVIR